MSVLFYFFVILVNFLSLGISANHVPLLAWSPRLSLDTVPALKHLGSAQLSQLLNEYAEEQPMIAVFLEPSLSNEDFRLRTDDGNLIFQALEDVIDDGNVEFMPNVASPMKALHLFKDRGYDWKTYHGAIPKNLITPTVLVFNMENDDLRDRSDVLQEHSSQIASLYREFAEKYPNMIAIYTAKRSDWSENMKNLNRVRREDTPVTVENKTHIMIRDTEIVLVAYSMAFNTGEEGFVEQEVEKHSVTNSSDGSFVFLEINFVGGLTANFSFTNLTYWKLNNIVINGEVLKSNEYIGSPKSWSWFCPLAVNYTNSKEAKIPVTFKIEGLQMQMGVRNVTADDFAFARAIDCIPYFSIGIWMGIVVVGLLLLIMAWGVIMIMDINTNDRFDDPKGKTITISATE